MTTNPPTFRQEVTTNGLTCTGSAARSTVATDLGTFFISPTQFACVSSPGYLCDGSYASPFESLNALLIYVNFISPLLLCMLLVTSNSKYWRLFRDYNKDFAHEGW